MKFLFVKAKRQVEALERVEKEAAEVHEKNITKIQQTRQKVDKLNVVLKQNNIVFQLAHVIGHTK